MPTDVASSDWHEEARCVRLPNDLVLHRFTKETNHTTASLKPGLFCASPHLCSSDYTDDGSILSRAIVKGNSMGIHPFIAARRFARNSDAFVCSASQANMKTCVLADPLALQDVFGRSLLELLRMHLNEFAFFLAEYMRHGNKLLRKQKQNNATQSKARTTLCIRS